MMKARSLDVYMNRLLVGGVDYLADGGLYFRYKNSWLEREDAIPVSLALPLTDQAFSGSRVLNVFDNLLPDNLAIRNNIAARLGLKSAGIYHLLEGLGRDFVGALQFLPKGFDINSLAVQQPELLSDTQIKEKIERLAIAPLGIDRESEFRLSLAGVQEKTALLRMNEKWYLAKGERATTHILKPQIPELKNAINIPDSVDNEFFCMKFLKNMGFSVANVEILSFAGTRVLSVERFDRRWTQSNQLLRIPQEDLCQALSVPSSLKYEADGGPGIKKIMSLLSQSDEPERDMWDFIKSQIVFWLMAATDAHAKNYSIFLKIAGRYSMTPLYDVLSVQPLLDQEMISRKQARMVMAVGRNRHRIVADIYPRHFVQEAEKHHFSQQKVIAIFDEVLDQINPALQLTYKELPKDFAIDVANSIAKGIRHRAERITFYRQKSD